MGGLTHNIGLWYQCVENSWESTQLWPSYIHALVHFDMDNTVCGLPVKRIMHPPLLQLAVGCTCRVGWVGRSSTMPLYSSFVGFGFETTTTQVYIVCWHIGDATSAAKENKIGPHHMQVIILVPKKRMTQQEMSCLTRRRAGGKGLGTTRMTRSMVLTQYRSTRAAFRGKGCFASPLDF